MKCHDPGELTNSEGFHLVKPDDKVRRPSDRSRLETGLVLAVNNADWRK